MFEPGMTVVGKDGWRGTIQTALLLRGNEAQVLVQLDRDGQEVLVPSQALALQEDGSYYVPLGLADLDYQKADPNEPAGRGDDAGPAAGSVLLFRVDAQGQWRSMA